MGNRRIRGWLLVVAGLLAMAAAGCGESISAGSRGNEAQSEATEPLTTAQFKQEANRICQTGMEEKDQVVATVVKSIPPEELAEPAPEKLDKVVALMLVPVKKIATELSELQPPAKDQATLDEIVSKLEAGIAKSEAKPALFISGKPLGPAGDVARAAGLAKCNF
jgi:hypothetical protein